MKLNLNLNCSKPNKNKTVDPVLAAIEAAAIEADSTELNTPITKTVSAEEVADGAAQDLESEQSKFLTPDGLMLRESLEQLSGALATLIGDTAMLMRNTFGEESRPMFNLHELASTIAEHLDGVGEVAGIRFDQSAIEWALGESYTSQFVEDVVNGTSGVTVLDDDFEAEPEPVAEPMVELDVGSETEQTDAPRITGLNYVGLDPMAEAIEVNEPHLMMLFGKMDALDYARSFLDHVHGLTGETLLVVDEEPCDDVVRFIVERNTLERKIHVVQASLAVCGLIRKFTGVAPIVVKPNSEDLGEHVTLYDAADEISDFEIVRVAIKSAHLTGEPLTSFLTL